MNAEFRDYVLDGEWHSLLPRYFHLSNLVKGKRILDIGCGAGIGSSLLLEFGATSVNAVDHRPGVVNIAKMKHAQENLLFQEMYLEDLHFEDDTFDLVLCLDSGNPVTDISLIEEVRRVMKNDGQYICAIQTSPEKGLDSILPQYGYMNSGEHRTTFDSINTPQTANLTTNFRICHRAVQRPMLSYRFDFQPNKKSSTEARTNVVHDLGDDASQITEIWFCGTDITRPENVEVRLPYASIVSKIARVLSNANQSSGVHDTELPYRRERQATSEFRVVSLGAITDDPPLDDLGLEEETTIRSETTDGFDVSRMYDQMKNDFQNVVQQAQSALAERDKYISHLVDTVHGWEQRFKTGVELDSKKTDTQEEDMTKTKDHIPLKKRAAVKEKLKKNTTKKKKPTKKTSPAKKTTKKTTKKTAKKTGPK